MLADRICEDHLAKVTHTKAKVDALMKSTRPQQSPHQLLGQLERENIDFQLSSRRAEAADDEFRQLARRLTDAIEDSAPNLPALEAEIERRLKGAP